ncbi:MAG: Xylose isomerase domain protein barrel [Chloroflexi bacterium]|nr:Xylose isomerase domain protein barrel [Chloroflexota bacterium]
MAVVDTEDGYNPAGGSQAKFFLSAFGDEIAEDFDTQLEILEKENIHFVELRGAWGKNVANFDEADLARIEQALKSRGIKVSAIGSPVGKIKITGPFEPELRRLERIIEIARRLETPYIRMFSFFIPADEGEAAFARHRPEVIRRLKEFVKLAEKHDVILLHENEKEIYGDTAEHCLDILSSVNSPNFRMTFDPANFVQCNIQPFREAFPKLEQFITYIHIKDAFFKDGRVVVAGAGDGEVAALLQALSDKGYQGFVSLEPHLSASGTFSGFSGPELFHEAVTALNSILKKVNPEVINAF